MRPRPDRPEWDTAIWLNVLGIPGTPGMFAFYREMEQWMRQRFDGVDSVFRPEWSKGWAFSEDRPYEDAEALGDAHALSALAGALGPDDQQTDGTVALSGHRRSPS
jgi:hypothetical protein